MSGADGDVVRRIGASFVMLCLLGAAGVPAASQPPGLDIDITGTSLDELFGVDITSVSRTAERYQDSAAAIFILTAEDIARTGVTSIPDALRLVPGVQVSRVDASKWAVSIRGFHGRTSNKLLVMIDGRSVYNPLFAGVLWEARDVLLEDVKQIEVVRGPGGSLWGANAVNGVINIITKRADATQGTMVVAGGGVEERAFGAVRHGWAFGDAAHGRVYAKHQDRDSGYSATGDAGDESTMTRAGFRFDWGRDSRQSFTLQGDAFSGEIGESNGDGSSQDVEHRGGNLSFHWKRSHDRAMRQLRATYDRTDLDNLALGEVRDTLDLEFQENRSPTGRAALSWGLGYRFTTDEITDGPVLEVTPSERNDNLFSGFVQGIVRFPAHHGRLQVGTKIERNDYTGTEIQPAARYSWAPDDERTWWAGISRAVRTPSRLEADLSAPISGSPRLRSEDLWAHELGFRWRPTSRLALDSAAFWNRYDELLTLEGSELGNMLNGDTYGFESNLALQVRPWWRLHAVYSLLRLDLELAPGSSSPTPPEFIEGSDPRHQFSVRTFADAERLRMEFDLTVRFVDDLPALGVDEYTELDLRIGWRPTSRLDLSLVGRNLLHNHHREQAGLTTTEVEPSVFVRLRLDF